MRGHPDIVRLGHIGDPPGLGDPTGVRDVGLDDVDTSGFKVGAAVLAGEETFSQLTSGARQRSAKSHLDEEGL